jgi:hypothetical protein
MSKFVLSSIGESPAVSRYRRTSGPKTPDPTNCGSMCSACSDQARSAVPKYMGDSRGHLRKLENSNPVCRIAVSNTQGAGLTAPMRTTVRCICLLLLLSVIGIAFCEGEAQTETCLATGTWECRCACVEFTAPTELFSSLATGTWECRCACVEFTAPTEFFSSSGDSAYLKKNGNSFSDFPPQDGKRGTERVQTFYRIYVSMVGPEGFEPPTKRL